MANEPLDLVMTVERFTSFGGPVEILTDGPIEGRLKASGFGQAEERDTSHWGAKSS